MELLFTKYSVSEIVLFIIILAIAIKELVNFIDWVKNRIKQVYDKDYETNDKEKKLEDRVNELEKFYDEKKIVDDTFLKIDKTFQSINKRIDILIESDKEDIKSYITRQHHYFVYEVKWIDDYSLDCIERRFNVYESENGNSFIKGLISEIRALPKQPPYNYKDKYNETAKYVQNVKRKSKEVDNQ